MLCGLHKQLAWKYYGDLLFRKELYTAGAGVGLTWVKSKDSYIFYAAILMAISKRG